MHRVPASQVVYSMSARHQPVLRVALPARLTFETLDCFAGQVKSCADTVATLDFSRVNPATGPVYLEGVRPGDVVAVHIREIRVSSPGIMVAAPGAGVLGDLVQQPETKMVEIKDGQVQLGLLTVPVAPMIGVIGLAPAEEDIPCGVPGRHGGNMDTTLIAAGSTVYLPAQVEGGLLAMGDLHALMGDGEIMVSGVEVAGEVDVTVTCVPNWSLEYPLVVTPRWVAVLASAATLDEAATLATRQMAGMLQAWLGCSLNEAGMLLSAVGQLQISQVVDPLKTARMALPRHMLRQLGVPLAF
ncbi:acetamidase/formamidase family protein [Desulfurispora thermophila]|uniref:acetamidase/formamidase family protein n=1 Tax=Desulfurispora thermophila TaxID=265470 RepID=UPI00036C15D2|nr:acetamidase/formamidase family protein [Desulfurispora thermophila]